MVKVHKRSAPGGQLEAVQETPSEADGKLNAKEHGFAVLFAACVELQELLRAAEEERDGLREQVTQLQSRCGELTERVRRLEDGESSAGLEGVGECVCGGRRAQNGYSPNRSDGIRRSVRPTQVPPLHALLRGNFLVDGSSDSVQEGNQKLGTLGEAGVLQEDDVNLEEVPTGNDIWALMDQSVRMRIEKWVAEQGRAVKDYGPLSELDGGSVRSSTHDHRSLAEYMICLYPILLTHKAYVLRMPYDVV